MPLTDEQAEDLYRMVRELHAAMLARRGMNVPVAGRREPSRVAANPTHDPADPVVKVIPKSWRGEELRGKRYSECPPAFLGMLSHMLDAFADKAELDGDPQKQRYAKWDRENAETARKWRAKLTGQGEIPRSSDAELDATF